MLRGRLRQLVEVASPLSLERLGATRVAEVLGWPSSHYVEPMPFVDGLLLEAELLGVEESLRQLYLQLAEQGALIEAELAALRAEEVADEAEGERDVALIVEIFRSAWVGREMADAASLLPMEVGNLAGAAAIAATDADADADAESESDTDTDAEAGADEA